jgi:hypothetical protein
MHHAPSVLGHLSDLAKEQFTRDMAYSNSVVAHPLRGLGVPTSIHEFLHGNKHGQTIEHIKVNHGQVHLTGTKKQQAEEALMLTPGKGFLGSAQEVMGIGPGVGLLAVQGAHHPLGTAESVGRSIGSSMVGTATHGRYGTKGNTPLDDALNIWTAATLGAGAAGRVGAIASADSAKAAMKAAVFRPHQPPRVLHVGEGEFSKPVIAAASRNPAAALVQRHIYDRLTQHSLRTGQTDLGSVILRRFGSPETRMARLARNHLRVENELGAAPGHELERYGTSVTKRAAKGRLGGLTMAQQHAAFISSLGHTPETFARASENAIAHADHLAQLEGVPADVIRKNHEDLLAKTKLSAQYFDQHGHLSHPKVKQAAEAMQRAISAREDTRGMTADEIHHALGSRWYAVHHLAENPTAESLHQQLADEAKVEAIHEQFRAKGEELQKHGAFYLPQSSETKALTKMRQGVTRRPGPYGFSAPKGEKTYAQMGHLFNTGDFRTQAVPLAQHAFGKAKMLQSQQRLHEMLLALSKKTPEEVGHAHPIPIRVKGAPTAELKKFINELYQGDHAKAEGSGAEALWKHLMPGHVPEGEDVRYLHPDVAGVFKPHHASELARNIGRFNQLIRAQRFLNPKYGIWNAQNAMVGLPQQGALMPANALRYLRTVRKLDPETYSKIESTVGAGMSKSLTAPGDQKAVQHLAGFWHHVNDHAYRMMSFTHEARAMGYHSADDLKRLMNSKDPKVVADRHQVIQSANREAIDYGAMTATERESVRRYAAYWPWTRGATAWTLRLAKEHPLWAQVNLEAGRRGKKYVDEFYAKHGGMVPPNQEGAYPAKSGPIDMEAFNTPSTLAQDAEAVSGMFNSGASKYLTGTALGQAAPAVKVGQELLTGLNKYGSAPKSGSAFGQTLHDLAAGIEPLQLGKAALGKGRPGSGIAPGGLMHEAERWAGYPQERGVNYDDLAQYGASIEKSSLRGPAQAQYAAKQQLVQLDQLAKKVKLDPGERQTYVRYWKAQAVLNVTLTTAAKKAGIVSDDYRKAEKSLSFQDPVAYLMAYATAASKLGGSPGYVKEARDYATQIMNTPGHTKQQKGDVLYKVAQKLWDGVNPSTISSSYYKRLAQAGL